MVVRFAPTEGGQWDYLVNSNIAGWDGKTGSFTAAAKELDLTQPGDASAAGARAAFQRGLG